MPTCVLFKELQAAELIEREQEKRHVRAVINAYVHRLHNIHVRVLGKSNSRCRTPAVATAAELTVAGCLTLLDVVQVLVQTNN